MDTLLGSGVGQAAMSAAPNESVFPSMSFQTRMIGLLISAGIGYYFLRVYC